MSATARRRGKPRNSMALAAMACDLDFAVRYGPISKGFIEAHHLKAIITLEEGVAVAYDIAADLAVLCRTAIV
jgi:predicted HNH restriction endonuclease